jgi:decaprenylphospho-beta-D-ribofuranose 2-oxidase
MNLLVNGPRRVCHGYGRALASDAVVARPGSIDELRNLFSDALAEGMPITARGAGRSYGDASLNGRGLVVDTRQMNHILSWDSQEGVIDLEPGVTMEGLWRHVLPDGWWPAVVPGTMHPTIGGCMAMNIHGKNHFRAGAFGDHIVDFDLLTPTGELLHCSRQDNPDLFHGAIGGFGMLGLATRIRLKVHKVNSAYLRVKALSLRNLDALFDAFEANLGNSDYLVGWVDCFAKGSKLGRSVIHRANYDNPDASSTAANSYMEGQALPQRFFGLIPRELMWRLFKPWLNNIGMRVVNWTKFYSTRLLHHPDKEFQQSHVAFAFLLDYVPRWRDAYGKGGFIQVQPFLPTAEARLGIRNILATCHQYGIVPYLAVFKKHRTDDFLLSHAIDGYSLAMDFRITPKNRTRVWELGQAIGDIVVKSGGRFYFAKDAVATDTQVQQSFGEQRIASFLALKQRCDPHGLLTSELSRRVLPSLPHLSR